MSVSHPVSHSFDAHTMQSGLANKNKAPWRLMLLFMLLMVIIVWLGLAGAALQTYQGLQRSAQQRLTAELRFLQHLQHLPSTGVVMTANDGVKIFSVKKPLPKELKQSLIKNATTVSALTVKQLGWQAYGLRGEVLAMVMANTQPVRVIATPIAKSQWQRTFITIGLLVSLAIIVVMSLFTLLWQARIRRRIAYIDETANAIMRGDLQKRIPINPAFHDEHSRLALTLNKMLDRIAQLMQGLRQVNNNIAHDLKSPLNRMRSRMEVALMNSRSADEYQQALAQSIEDVDALLQTFQALLLMGNLESNARSYQLQSVSLSALTEKLGELYTALAEEKGHHFHVSIHENVQVFANANLLGQALGNLLDNAIKYTPDNGSIRFAVSQTAAIALIVISDNGPGISASEREAVFERFKRLDSARQLPGAGLGMSLVRAILDAHHATIQLHDNQPGLRVEVRLRANAK